MREEMEMVAGMNARRTDGRAVETAPRRPMATKSAFADWDSAEGMLLVRLLEQFTPSGSERAQAEWLAQELAGMGLRLEVDGVGNLIAELPATVGDGELGAPVMLLGHADTVSGFIPVRREGERLYGRGAVDAKGPLAAFLCATLRLARSGGVRRRAVIVVGAVEEEAATSAGARAVLERWRPAYCVIGEPSGASDITLGYKGRLLVHSRHAQAMAHTARPQDSVSARAFGFWQALNAHADGWNVGHGGPSLFEQLQPSLRSINSRSDGFTDTCEMEIGYRLPPSLSPDALAATVADIARDCGAEITLRGAETAYSGPRSGRLVSAFLRAMRAARLEPGFKRKTGTSDMNVVAPVWRCPIVAYGPGDASLDHTPEEHIELAEYQQGIAVLERVLTALVTEEVAPC